MSRLLSGFRHRPWAAALLLGAVPPPRPAEAACPWRVVEPPGLKMVVQTPAGPLPRGSLVQVRPDISCEPDISCNEGQEGMGVEVVSRVWFHREDTEPPVAAGDRVCVHAASLSPARGRWFLVAQPPPGESPAPGLPPGTWVGPLGDEASCEAQGVPFEPPLPRSRLRDLYPVDEPAQRTAERVRQHYIERFGPLGPERFRVNEWGRVALPFEHIRDPAEIAEACRREGLDTPERREKVLTAFGGNGTYAHFTGADPRFTDVWGNPTTILALLDLARSWHRACLELRPADPAPCLLQVGDIAWYNDTRPDPLGHRDHRGDCVDIRLFREDASRYEAWWNRPDDRPGAWEGYSLPLTAAFVRHVRERHHVRALYFGDPRVEGATPVPGHDDHIHLCFAP